MYRLYFRNTDKMTLELSEHKYCASSNSSPITRQREWTGRKCGNIRVSISKKVQNNNPIAKRYSDSLSIFLPSFGCPMAIP